MNREAFMEVLPSSTSGEGFSCIEAEAALPPPPMYRCIDALCFLLDYTLLLEFINIQRLGIRYFELAFVDHLDHLVAIR